MTEQSRAKRLKAASHDVHDGLDKAIMAAEPFADRERYIRLLRVQHLFHRDLAALYDAPALASLIPDLARRRRETDVLADLTDLNAEPAPADGPPRFTTGEAVDVPTTLGWLYVVEGSNLGAAFLLKAAAALDLSETFGARHLAAAPEGRANAWRAFTAALDAPSFTHEEEERVNQGAKDAFRRVRTLVDAAFYPNDAAA
ncbi:biliverdin-producing heme oxygenase [Brevundimonas faecalis]|uniref:biliverdin-producing heme oxygenase n=1 Tax=Brevundimonas faecalis TaxID=947378 RepID=UPI00361756CA